MRTLTPDNIQRAMVIQCRDHLDWGTFVVQNIMTSNCTDFKDNGVMWADIRGDTGVRVLNPSEFPFWEIVSPDIRCVLIHFVQMEKYDVPKEVVDQGEDEIEAYILDNGLVPTKVSTRDWEICDTDAEEK